MICSLWVCWFLSRLWITVKYRMHKINWTIITLSHTRIFLKRAPEGLFKVSLLCANNLYLGQNYAVWRRLLMTFLHIKTFIIHPLIPSPPPLSLSLSLSLFLTLWEDMLTSSRTFYEFKTMVSPFLSPYLSSPVSRFGLGLKVLCEFFILYHYIFS